MNGITYSMSRNLSKLQEMSTGTEGLTGYSPWVCKSQTRLHGRQQQIISIPVTIKLSCYIIILSLFKPVQGAVTSPSLMTVLWRLDHLLYYTPWKGFFLQFQLLSKYMFTNNKISVKKENKSILFRFLENKWNTPKVIIVGTNQNSIKSLNYISLYF